MTDDDEGDEAWTPVGGDRVMAAAQALADAIRAHASPLTSIDSRDASAVHLATQALVPFVREHSDAEFAYTHTGSLFGGVDALYDDVEEVEGDVVENVSGGFITVMRRRDHRAHHHRRSPARGPGPLARGPLPPRR